MERFYSNLKMKDLVLLLSGSKILIISWFVINLLTNKKISVNDDIKEEN